MAKPPPPPAPTKVEEQVKGKTEATATLARKLKLPKSEFFSFETKAPDVLDDRVEQVRVRRIHRIVVAQSTAVIFLSLTLIAGMPFFQTVFQFYAMTSNHQVRALTPLIMPNMTGQAVLSWATNSITEIMTFGFGDYQTHLRDQRIRFTAKGWESFVGAFDRMKIGEAFRQRQLVLTTVPSNTAAIVSQGENKKHVYEWHVQLPVVLTYATNDNVTRRDRASIVLTIVRVPSSESPAGIAIQTWELGG